MEMFKIWWNIFLKNRDHFLPLYLALDEVEEKKNGIESPKQTRAFLICFKMQS